MAPEEATPQTTDEAVLKTLLLSDLVGSTKMVEKLGDKRTFELFGRHDRVARDLLEEHGGREIDKTDGFLMLFERPIDAVGYAIAYHEALADLSVEMEIKVASRVGIHLGEVYLRENPPEDVARGAKPLEVEGLAKPVAARMMSLATGNQTLLTRTAFDLARRAAVGRGDDAEALKWLAHGAYRFKGVDEPVQVFEVGIEGLSPLRPPPDSEKVHRAVEDETILGWRPAPDQGVPQRRNWVLERKLGEGGFGEVWLANHAKTGDRRVLKFCFDRERLKSLQREVTLFRLLKDALGNRDDIARILDWNFETAPFFIESEFSEGGSLLDWAQEHGGVTSLSTGQRLGLAAQVAEALAAAHSVGVLHKDLKPGNVLVRLDHEGKMHSRLTDFGIGMVTDHERLAAAGITVLGFTETGFLDEALATGGTQLYMAPELLEGKPASVQADIYALGVMLYQLVVGNLKQALAPGWERKIDDELLLEDIAALVDGDPERRIRDAGEVARRLRTIDERRDQREAEARAREEAERTRLALERSRKRHKLTVAVVAVLTVFAASMGGLSWKIKQERDRAEREAETARQVSGFLIDLFDVVDPEKARGEEITARELLDQGAERIEDELHDQPVVKSRLTNVLGRVCFKLGMYSQAEDLWQETIELQKRTHGPEDLSVATTMMSLAVIFMQQGRLDEAQPLFEQALAIKESTLGDTHEEVADLLSNLSILHSYQGNRDEEIRLAERALQVYESSLGSQCSQVAWVLNNLADTYVKVGRIEEGERALKRALSILLAEEGEDHPEVARVQDNLAVLYCLLEKTEQAEDLYRQALAIREKALGPEHPMVAVTLSRLGHLHATQGRLRESRQLLERALAISDKTFGMDHPLTGDVLTYLGNTARMERRFAEARKHLERALTVLEDALGADNPDVKDTVHFLALVDHDTGRLDEAAKGLERALRLAETASGPDHPEVGVIARDLALVERDQGRTVGARSLMERAVAIRTKLLGADHPSVTALKAELAGMS